MSLGNYKLKQLNKTTCLLGWLKLKILTSSNAGKNVEQQELSFLEVGMQSDTGTLQDSLAVSYKGKQSLTIQPSISAPRYLPK